MAKRRPRRPDRWTDDYARGVLDECAGSGMTLAAFARSRGVTPARLYWWRRRLGEITERTGKGVGRGESATISLIPARVVDGAAASTCVVVRLPDDVAIELGAVSPIWVAALIRELGR